MSDDNVEPEDIDNSPTELPADRLSNGVDYREKFNEVSNELIEQKEKINDYRRRIRELESVEHTNRILDQLIRPMAKSIFWFMCSYCCAVGLLLLVSCFVHTLPDKVLSALVGSTAITVVGLVGTIVAGIFSGARRHSA